MPTEDLLVRHSNNRQVLVACARGGLGSFQELAKLPLPVLRANYLQVVKVEVLFNPHLKSDD